MPKPVDFDVMLKSFLIIMVGFSDAIRIAMPIPLNKRLEIVSCYALWMSDGWP